LNTKQHSFLAPTAGQLRCSAVPSLTSRPWAESGHSLRQAGVLLLLCSFCCA